MKSYNEILSDVTKTATKIPQSDYLDTGKYRIFDQGKEYSLGFSNDELGVVTDYPYIIFGDHTRVVKYVNEPCFIGADGVKLLKVINKDFNPRFVYYNILAKPIENQGYARHFKFLKEIQFTEKTLSVQTNIVTVLDTIQSAIDNKKQQLALLDEAVKSRFIEMFGEPVQNPMGWKKTELGNLYKEVRYGTSKPASENGKYTYLRMNNITYEGELDLTNIKSIDISEDELPKCSVRKGDVLFNRTNSIELCGKTCLYKLDETMVIAGYIIRVRVSEKLNPQYVSTFFNTKSIKKLLREMAKGAVNQANINAREMQSIQIPVPPISLQNEYESFVQQIDKSKFVVKQQIADLQELFDSKMQEYFGE